jgi:hypothetical protein
MRRCIAPRLYRPSTGCPASARRERLTATPSMCVHGDCILRYPLQASRVAALAYSCELGLDLLHAHFHVDDRFGRVEEVAVAGSILSSACCLVDAFRLPYPTSDRSFSLLSSALLRSCCSSLRTTGMGYWNASSHDWNVRGSGASADMAIAPEIGTCSCCEYKSRLATPRSTFPHASLSHASPTPPRTSLHQGSITIANAILDH